VKQAQQESNLNFKVFAVFACTIPVIAQTPDFGGPSVLSRGMAPQRRDTATFHITPFVSVGATYDQDLTPYALTPTGDIPRISTWGATASAGVDLSRQWRSSVIDLGYVGSSHYYPDAKHFSGIDQFMHLSFQHSFNKSFSVVLNEAAGISSRNTYFQQTNPSVVNLYIPNQNFFDSRSVYLSSTADVIFRKSVRLSFSMGGGEIISRYHADGLAGTTGWLARGDVNYRVNRNTTIGMVYNFSQFYFTGAYGESDNHSTGFVFSKKLSRRWQFSSTTGVYRSESNTLQEIQIDPVVAAILGSAAGRVQVAHAIHYGLNVAADLSAAYGKHGFSLSYMRGVTPGNGFYTTAEQELVSANYGYTGLRQWALSAGASYGKFRALQQDLRTSRQFRGTGTISRRLVGAISSSASISYYVVDTPYEAIRRSTYSATLSLSYSPGDLPLRVW
jgi:hypothetical protein